MYTVSERIDLALNHAGLRATAATLGFIEKAHVPRWMLILSAVVIGNIFLLDLKGELDLRALMIAVLEHYL